MVVNKLSLAPIRRGFSLIEVLVVVAILGLLAAIGAPVFQSFLIRNDLDISANTLSLDLYRAQALSRAMARDNSWGVHIQNGSVTLFIGASYASRNSAFDETYIMPSVITPSGQTDYLFAKFSGLPMTTGATTLTASAQNTTTVTLNSKGMIEH